MKSAGPMILRVFAIAALLAAGAAATPTSYAAMQAGDDAPITTLPPQYRYGDVTYVSGGIGQSEAAVMRREQSAFPLSLEFVERAAGGEQYLADINVTIEDHRGNTVLDTVAEGPFLLVTLPNGKYRVTADNGGRAKVRDIVVAERKHERVVFVW